MPFEDFRKREVRVAVDLLNAIPYRQCAGETYGDEDADYSATEHAAVNAGQTQSDWLQAGDMLIVNNPKTVMPQWGEVESDE